MAVAKAALEQKKLLETQQLEILSAQQELINKLLPKGESKPLEGKIETDEKFGYIAELVGQDRLNAIAGEIAQAVKSALDKSTCAGERRVLIVDALDFASGDLVLHEVRKQINSFQTLFNEQKTKNSLFLQPVEISGALEFTLAAIPAAALTALSLAPNLLSLAADIVGYFSTDFKITGKQFSL